MDLEADADAFDDPFDDPRGFEEPTICGVAIGNPDAGRKGRSKCEAFASQAARRKVDIRIQSARTIRVPITPDLRQVIRNHQSVEQSLERKPFKSSSRQGLRTLLIKPQPNKVFRGDIILQRDRQGQFKQAIERPQSSIGNPTRPSAIPLENRKFMCSDSWTNQQKKWLTTRQKDQKDNEPQRSINIPQLKNIEPISSDQRSFRVRRQSTNTCMGELPKRDGHKVDFPVSTEPRTPLKIIRIASNTKPSRTPDHLIANLIMPKQFKVGFPPRPEPNIISEPRSHLPSFGQVKHSGILKNEPRNLNLKEFQDHSCEEIIDETQEAYQTCRERVIHPRSKILVLEPSQASRSATPQARNTRSVSRTPSRIRLMPRKPILDTQEQQFLVARSETRLQQLSNMLEQYLGSNKAPQIPQRPVQVIRCKSSHRRAFLKQKPGSSPKPQENSANSEILKFLESALSQIVKVGENRTPLGETELGEAPTYADYVKHIQTSLASASAIKTKLSFCTNTQEIEQCNTRIKDLKKSEEIIILGIKSLLLIFEASKRVNDFSVPVTAADRLTDLPAGKPLQVSRESDAEESKSRRILVNPPPKSPKIPPAASQSDSRPQAKAQIPLNPMSNVLQPQTSKLLRTRKPISKAKSKGKKSQEKELQDTSALPDTVPVLFFESHLENGPADAGEAAPGPNNESDFDISVAPGDLSDHGSFGFGSYGDLGADDGGASDLGAVLPSPIAPQGLDKSEILEPEKSAIVPAVLHTSSHLQSIYALIIPERVDKRIWGQSPKVIRPLNLTYLTYRGEILDGKTQYANGEITIINCEWNHKQVDLKSDFVDSEFPGRLRSLQGTGQVESDKDREKLEKMAKYTFKRIAEVKPDLEVIQDTISPGDVSQGELGNCYFLSSLASVAKNPHRVERNLFQRVKSRKGGYCVSFCITGIWTPVYIDDLFPVREDGQLPFSSPKTQAMWPMLFEKAYAKQYGAYWHIGHGGQAQEALRDITGAPTEHFDLKEEDVERRALQTIADADKKNFIMTVSSKGKGEETSENGIITGHAYSLLGVVTLSSGLRLLKLRNPWGKGEWTGPWSDKSTLWTDDFKQQAGWVDLDDGVFFMAYEDFRDNFESFTVAYYHDSYYYSALQTTNGKGDTDTMQVTVAETGEYYVGVSQPSKFQFSDDPQHEHGYVSVVIFERLDSGKFKYVGGFGNTRRDPWTKVHLQKGEYLVFVYTNWQSANRTYTLWTYGAMNAIIHKVSNCRAKFEVVLATALTEMALASEDKWKIQFEDEKTNLPQCRSKNSDIEGYGYYIYQNIAGPKRVFKVTLRMEATNYKFIHPTAGTEAVELEILDGQSKIVIYRVECLPSKASFKSNFTLGWVK